VAVKKKQGKSISKNKVERDRSKVAKRGRSQGATWVGNGNFWKWNWEDEGIPEGSKYTT
jgi:hypothetical protein